MPRFSVVVAVYNKESYIRATLESVLKQTFRDLELVVYNDGSTDNSKSIINSINDNRIRYYEGANKGAGAARNTALSKAKGELIALLDADVEYKVAQGFIERVKKKALGEDVLKSIKPGEQILDIACGSGVMARRMAALGAEVELEGGYIEARAPGGLRGGRFRFEPSSVGGTANVLMAAVLVITYWPWLSLALLGFPLGGDMPGRLPESCLAPRVAAAPTVESYGRRAPGEEAPPSDYDPEMAERLRSLGYLR